MYGLSYFTLVESIRIEVRPATVVQPEKSEMRHSVQRRLEFIEFRLFWEGQINRSDLVDQFRVSVPQASADLKRYQEIAPGFISYDSHLKTYRPTAKFTPQHLVPSGDAYLAHLRLRESGVVGESDTWANHVPDFSVVPILRRTVRPEILRAIMEAARMSLAVKIKYQSASSNSTTWRWIAPHALGFDLFSWHARAWCLRHEQFRDFVLTRVMEIGESRPEQVDRGLDHEWNQSVTFVLQPNPNLNPGARRAVELDFGMESGKCTIETRVSLSFYLERHLGLKQSPEPTDPNHQRLVLVNRNEVERIREAAKVRSFKDPECA